jgi:hypothetical protein
MKNDKNTTTETFKVRHGFSDYKNFSPEDAYKELDSIKAQIAAIVADNPECKDFIVSGELEKGYYDERWFVFKILGTRELNAKEKAAQADNAKRQEAWERQQYEKLKQKFESDQK